MEVRKQDVIDYHQKGRKGKIEVVATKPCRTQWDLSLAYTPGVAEPCLEIEKTPDLSFEYTARGNLVAVVSNGTAVLGLGNIGALAGKPVMEGKAVLFKRFADIDVFDLEVNSENPEDVIKFCQLIEPTFGGINLEDIKAPECFLIEETLRKTMSIPVMHDDQHGTAIISGAALLNSVDLAGKDLDKIRVVVNGAGAAGIACVEHYIRMGVSRENITLCDTKGVVYAGRSEGMNPYKARLAVKTQARTLADALAGADVFVGLSVAGCVTAEMVRSMANRPIIFALANPVPEISYEAAKAARPDVIIATGRSDYPNQVNNVLGFPFIFRGALDVRARTINHEMEIAATRSLAALAREDVPDSVLRAYGLNRLQFGPEYVIPKPFDRRVLIWEAAAVAEAAMASGVAQLKLDLAEYREQLSRRMGRTHEVMQGVRHRAKSAPKRIVFSEGEHERIIRACYHLVEEKIALPTLIGRPAIIQNKVRELGLHSFDVRIVEPAQSPSLEAYVDEFYQLRQRRGITRTEARERMLNPNYFGAMMVRQGDADGFLAGVSQHYAETIRPALEIIKTRENVNRVSGVYVIVTRQEVYFFSDTTVNIEPSAEDLAEIALLAAGVARDFNFEPRLAMLSFSNFGSTRHPLSEKMRRAAELVKQRYPEMMVDGEMMADTAVVREIIQDDYPFSILKNGANVLIFPDLGSANIAYKLMMRLGGAEALGPILVGLGKSVHVLQRGATEDEIVNMAAIAVAQAQVCEAGLRRQEIALPASWSPTTVATSRSSAQPKPTSSQTNNHVNKT
ncbi:MAG TPA: NADP-dependent malic enzyme [Terriglobia bacterium]|nr:NADP-dependent malic enzyme [Terriglobia bacterium]